MKKMPIYQQVITGVFALILLVAMIKLFSAPLKWVLKLLVNTGLGFLGLLIFNLAGAYAGITLGLNLINAVVIGILGLPGLVLLLILKWMFKV